MKESKINLIEEELVKLSMRSSRIVPNEKPTFLCIMWSLKTYNLDSFHAQMKSIWKTKRKVKFQLADQNLFQIMFDNEEDLKAIMNERPWFFRRQLVIFGRLLNPTERNQVRLTQSPFWLKVGLCPPECDKKDLIHVVGLTFDGVIQAEEKDDFCRI